MAPDVANAMLENSKYMKQFDMLSAKLGEINARYKGEGVRFLGYNADGVEMYSFSGKFLDDDGQMKTCMPSGTLIIGGSGLIKMPHGPVTQVEEPGPNARHKDLHQKGSALRYGALRAMR